MMNVRAPVKVKKIKHVIKVPEHIKTEEEFLSFVEDVREWGNPVQRINVDTREIISFEEDMK